MIRITTATGSKMERSTLKECPIMVSVKTGAVLEDEKEDAIDKI